MKKITKKGIALAFNLASFIVVISALYVLKAGLSLYWKWKLSKDGYGPLLLAIDNIELAIEATQPIVWMIIGGAIALVIVIICAWAFIDWRKLAQQMDIQVMVEDEIKKLNGGEK